MTDELEALFDKIADEQQAESGADKPPSASGSAASSEDELEALFDEISAGTQTPPSSAPAPAEAASGAEPSEDELEALFDELSAGTPATPSPASAPAEAASDELPAATEEMQMIPADPVDMSDKPLYDRLGAILRQLHDSMRELGYDRALQDVATEVTDAKGRLEYVAALTEQAATRVLNSIDIGMPQQEELSKTAHALEKRWTKLFEGELEIEAFKQLAEDSRSFAVTTATRAEEEKARLMEIMMAQDFQDITGQVIKKVVIITQKLQQELAQLLRDNAPPETREKVVDLMAGPDVPDKAMGQDDVDSLLANLGF